MTVVPNRFPYNDILSLTADEVRYDLAESVGPDLVVNELLPAADAAFGDVKLSYGTAAGNPLLRGYIAARHGTDADHVVTMVGGMQALFLTAFIVCEAGDDVVVGMPVFPNARSVLQSVGANIVELPFDFDDGYRLDNERLRAALTPGTKLVSLAAPQNPSGVDLTADEVSGVLSAVDAVCPDAFVLIDETYREAVYGNAAARGSFVSMDERIVSCASLSKCHGAPGLRTGWAITRHGGLREQLVLGKFNTVISSSLADDALAIRVFQCRERIIARRRTQLREGLGKTRRLVDDHGGLIEWVTPDAGALCCIRLRPAAFDDAAVDRFYRELAARDVRVGRGPWFGEAPRVFRLGFGFLSMADLDEALRRLSAALKVAATVAA